MLDISLVLPAYNEQDNIVKVVTSAADSLDQLGKTWEIVVVDNHSNDKTPQLVEELSLKDNRIRCIVHNENKLYSGSCQTALNEAKGKYIAIMDSDDQYAASDILKFIEKLEKGANIVFGWRKKRKDPFFRLIVSKVFNSLGKFKLKFPFHDLNCGYRVFDKTFQQSCKIKHKINLSNPELYVRAKQAGLKMDEVAIQH